MTVKGLLEAYLIIQTEGLQKEQKNPRSGQAVVPGDFLYRLISDRLLLYQPTQLH